MKKIAAFCLVSVAAVPQFGLAQSSAANPAAANRQIPASEQPGARELRNAMQRIARNRRDVDALIDAGNAALLLNDADAALNFFRQADRLRPSDGRIKAGLGGAYVRSENPFEGLRYFDQAVKLGVSERVIAVDRGLAFDLLGNFERAQQDYQLASTASKSKRLTIQHAISLSLSGKGKEADNLLNPLLSQNDPAAWRARAFLLAARGEYKESQEVTRGFLDTRSAQRIERYLKQMPALTGPQQAAAIHLGHFPAKNIGRDSAIVRSVAANLPAVSSSGGDSRLTPSGTPFGAKPPKPSAPSIAELRIASAVKSSLGVVPVAQKQIAAVEIAPPPVASVPVQFPVKTASPEMKPAALETSLPKTKISETKVPVPTSPVQAGFDAIPPKNQNSSGPEKPDIKAPSETKLAVLPAQNSMPAKMVTKVDDKPTLFLPVKPATTTASISKDNVDDSPVIRSAPSLGEPSAPPASIAVATAQPAPTIPPKPGTATDNFDLGDIVDSIEIPDSEKMHEVEPVGLSKLPSAKKTKPAPEAKVPASASKPVVTTDESVSTSSRYWVQIATGDISAMRGEYRRLSRKYPGLFKDQQGWSSPWKTMSRLVVGPFNGYTAAKEWYDALKDAGGDSFVWRSAQGTKVTKLSSK